MPRLDPDFAALPLAALADAALGRARALGAQHADVRVERIVTQSIDLRDGHVTGVADDVVVGLAVRVGDRTMQSRLWDAHRLVAEYPATLTALETGEISGQHATAILDAGSAIDDPAARAAYEGVVLDYARGSTPARTRAYARTQADVHDPRTLQERHDLAAMDRRVFVTDLDAGMSMFGAILPTTLAHGIRDRLTRQAKAIKAVDAAPTAGDAFRRPAAAVPASDEPVFVDERTVDQVRADLFADMLLTGAPVIDPTIGAAPGGLGAIRAVVQVSVPVTTLTGVTSSGAELDGFAPIDPQTARRLAGDAAGWDRVFTDPITATVVAVDRYNPVNRQRRFLRARDRHCRFPGCRRPARYCDLDHTIDWAHGGPTSIHNLACLCKRHHALKHATDWTVRQLPGGSLEWTSPAGRTHLDHPTPRVVFLPSDAGPPDGGPPGGRDPLDDGGPPW